MSSDGEIRKILYKNEYIILFAYTSIKEDEIYFYTIGKSNFDAFDVEYDDDDDYIFIPLKKTEIVSKKILEIE